MGSDRSDDRVEYRGFISDNTRWDAFEHRAGDVVICTPSKCGTTWMQTLVALLIFDGPVFPGPLSELSPWLDMNTRPIDDVVADLAAQTHRRFIKTHTPLDGLVLDERVTYVCVGRDPRDAAVSMAHHMVNMDVEHLVRLRVDSVGLDGLDPDAERPEIDVTDLAPHLRRWMEEPPARGDGMESLATILHHVETFLAATATHANVASFHYGDLKADLAGQLLRLAEVLDIELSEARAVELAVEGSIDRMRSRASELAPNANQSLWKDDARFFRSGTGGEWASLVDEADQERYRERVAELTSAEVSDWVHQGRL